MSDRLPQFRLPIQMILVRFEQARGAGGVPKAWVPWLTGTPTDPHATPEVATLIRKAVSDLRAACADPIIGHGRDLMPGSDDEYELHNVDGGKIESVEQIVWQVVEVGQNKETRAELVLTWRSPQHLLAEAAK